MKQNNRANGRKPSKNYQALSARKVSMPPAVRSNPVFQRTIRYQLSEAETKSSDVITNRSLANLMYTSYATNKAHAIFSAVRLVRVVVYGNPSASAYQTIDFQWTGERGPQSSIQAIGTNTVIPCVVARPPRGSYASMWFNPWEDNEAASIIFAIGAQAGAICDVTVQFTLLDYSAVDAGYQLTNVSSPLADGFLGFNTLDNTTLVVTAGAGKWIPLGVDTRSQYYG